MNDRYLHPCGRAVTRRVLMYTVEKIKREIKECVKRVLGKIVIATYEQSALANLSIGDFMTS